MTPSPPYTDAQIERAARAYNDALATKYADESSYTDCPRCRGQGYHHGFGEDGNDPGWCDDCGGSQRVCTVSHDEAEQYAMRAALASLTQGGDDGE